MTVVKWSYCGNSSVFFMNENLKRELINIPLSTRKAIKQEHTSGCGIGLTLFDLSAKYNVSVSACLYIVKADDLDKLLKG